MKKNPVIEGILDGKKAFTGPEHVVIDLTNRCNLECIGCWTHSPLLEEKAATDEWKSRELSYNVLTKLIDELAGMGTARIRFTGGGEPFLHPRIMDIIKQVKDNGMICAVTTNGTLLNEKNVWKLANLGLDDLAVSVWAGTPETYAKTHPGQTGKTFERIERMLKLLSDIKDAKPYVLLCNVISNKNCHEIEKMVDFAAGVGADGIYFTLVDVIDGKTDSLLLSEEQAKGVLDDIKIIESTAGESRIDLDNFGGFVERLVNKDGLAGNYDSVAVDEIPCYVGWIFTRILANGDVSPCCRGVRKTMGNINEQCFKDIWYGEKMDEFRQKAKSLKKSDPYFDEIGCYKCCDNLMHNRQVHEMLGGSQ